MFLLLLPSNAQTELFHCIDLQDILALACANTDCHALAQNPDADGLIDLIFLAPAGGENTSVHVEGSHDACMLGTLVSHLASLAFSSLVSLVSRLSAHPLWSLSSTPAEESSLSVSHPPSALAEK